MRTEKRITCVLKLLAVAIGLLLPLADGKVVRAEGLAADLSEHLIAITAAFVGGEVMVFGTSDGEGDIVITITGPPVDEAVRRKERTLGIWVNRDRIVFEQAPSYFAIASSNPSLQDIASEPVRARMEIGIDQLGLRPLAPDQHDEAEIEAFRKALIRNKQHQGLYSTEPAPVTFIDSRLFRTTFDFPANVTPGIYRVEVYQLKEDQVTDAQRSTLTIHKVGLEADIYDFAWQRAELYGLFAVAISLAAGWLAGILFRRS